MGNQGGEATGGTKKAMKSVNMDKGLSTWSCESKPNSQEPGNIGKAKVKSVMHEKPDLNQGYRLTETHQRFGLIYLLKPNKDHRKRSDLWLPEAGHGGRGNWMKVVKRHKLPVIRQISTRDIMYNII